MRTTQRTRLASLATVLAASLGLTLAATPLTLDTTGVSFSDAPALASVALEWHDGLVLVFGAEGEIGANALIPDALAAGGSVAGRGRAADDAIAAGLVTDLGSGIVLTFDTTDMRSLQHDLREQLHGLGFDVHTLAQQPNVLHATHGSDSYRLVFGYEGGSAIRLYLGS